MARANKGAPYRWTGAQVRVVHHINNSGVLSVGTTRGVLEEVNEEGFVLRVAGGEDGEETHYFPKTSVIKVVLKDAQ